jgi:hypothetical protein
MRMGKVQLQIPYEVDLDNKAQVEAAKTLIIGCLDETGCDLEFQHFIEEHIVQIEDPSLSSADIPIEILSLATDFIDAGLV